MTHHFRAAAAAFALGGLLAAGARAAAMSSADRDFLVDTAQGATFELAVAKLALTKKVPGAVAHYAHVMIADHESLNPRLHEVARRNDVELPTTMTGDKQQSLDHLRTLDGPAFATAFVKEEADDNRSDTATEQKEIDTTHDAGVRTLVKHLQAADAKHAKMGEALAGAGQ